MKMWIYRETVLLRVLSPILIGMVFVGGTTTGFSENTTLTDNSVTPVSVWWSTNRDGLVEELIEHFNTTIGREKGVRIEFINYGSKLAQVLRIAYDEGSPGDIVTPQIFLQECVRKNWVLPLENMPGGKQFLADYGVSDRFIRGLHIINGKTYSVPTVVLTIKLVHNKELFVKAGIVDASGQAKPPITWAEMRDAARKITQLDPGNTFGIVLPMKNPWFFWLFKVIRPFASSVGHSYFDYQHNQYDFRAYKPVLEFLAGLRDDGSVVPGELAISDDAARIRFGQAGNVGMYVGASWDVAVFSDKFPAKVDWGVTEIPVLHPTQQYKSLITVSEGWNITASAQQKDLAKVMGVYKFLHSDVWQSRFYEEGKDIPVRPHISEIARKKPEKKGWIEFAEIRSTISLPMVPDRVIALEGPEWYHVFQMIYDGQADIDEALTDLDRRYNAAYQDAIAGGAANPALFHLPDFDLRIIP